MALPVIGILLAPITGGLSLVVSSAIGAVDAIKNKNWLGAIASVAGMFVPGTGAFASRALGAAAKTAGLLGKTVANVASAVQQGVYAVQAGMMAIKAKSPGGLLAAVASGVGAVAGGMGRTTGKLVDYGKQLQHWGNIVSRGESIVRAVKNKDLMGAASSALGMAGGFTKGKMADDLADYSRWVARADAVQHGLRSRNYLAAAHSGLSLAHDIRTPRSSRMVEPGRERKNKRLEQALELVERASYLQGAIRRKDAAGVAQAALLMGRSVAGIRNEAVLSGGTGVEQRSGSVVRTGARCAATSAREAAAVSSRGSAGEQQSSKSAGAVSSAATASTIMVVSWVGHWTGS